MMPHRRTRVLMKPVRRVRGLACRMSVAFDARGGARRRLVRVMCGTLACLALPTMAFSQENPARLRVALGLTSLPDALSTQCGNSANGGGSVAPELGAALAWPWRRVRVQVDTRLMHSLSFGCYL